MDEQDKPFITGERTAEDSIRCVLIDQATPARLLCPLWICSV